MNKRKVALAIILLLLAIGYFKLFYKTYNNAFVPSNADNIAAIDVKRIRNTLLWNIVTTPSQWKLGSLFSSSKDEVDIIDAIEMPDYVFVFTTKENSINTWNVVFEIKDSVAFEKGLGKFQFKKSGRVDEYVSTILGVKVMKFGNRIIVSNSLTNSNNCSEIANDLFVKNKCISEELLRKNIEAKSHIAIQIMPNVFLKQPSIATLNFDKNRIVFDAVLTPFENYSFTQTNFSYCDGWLCNAGFTQPLPQFYGLLNDSSKASISKFLNFNIDSLLQQNNRYYSIDVAGIKERIDSAITYSYDENFNEVKKVVADTLQEPAFEFIVSGKGCANVQDYWRRINKLEKTKEGELFTCMPFVKAYCKKINDSCIAVTSNNFNSIEKYGSANCVFFLNFLVDKMPSSMLKYMPDGVNRFLSNIQSIKVVANKKQYQINLTGIIQKNKNDLPIVPFY